MVFYRESSLPLAIIFTLSMDRHLRFILSASEKVEISVDWDGKLSVHQFVVLQYVMSYSMFVDCLHPTVFKVSKTSPKILEQNKDKVLTVLAVFIHRFYYFRWIYSINLLIQIHKHTHIYVNFSYFRICSNTTNGKKFSTYLFKCL